jgi:hypothetical protein
VNQAKSYLRHTATSDEEKRKESNSRKQLRTSKNEQTKGSVSIVVTERKHDRKIFELLQYIDSLASYISPLLLIDLMVYDFSLSLLLSKRIIPLFLLQKFTSLRTTSVCRLFLVYYVSTY